MLSHFRNIIYGANTRKTFGSDEQKANRQQSIASKRHTNFDMDWLLQRIPFCKTELGKRKYRIVKRLLNLSKSIRLQPWLLRLFLIQICSFRKAKGPGVSDSRCRSISARAIMIFQGHLRGPSTPIRARKGSGFVEIYANHGASPAELSRMLTLEICFSDSRSAAISAMAVSQRHLGGPCAPIRAQNA